MTGASLSTLPNPKPWGYIPWTDDEISFEFEDVSIGGKLITAKLTIEESQIYQLNDEELRKSIRMRLATALATAILESEFCETVSWNDAQSMGRTIAARCYLTPNDQIKLVRRPK